jgi:hypothetical protein
MARDDEPNRPITLGNMHCGHERAVNMDDWPDDATVPSFGPAHALQSLR